MADNDCGCAGSSSTPPGTRGPAASRTVASAFGGNVAVRRSACGPAKCPQPPLSQAEERSPYCQDWVSLLTTEAAGRLLIAIEGCLFFLKSKCSGVVWFNADTEQVDIRFPDFVSSLPKENNYGFLAKVVPTIRRVCVDGVDGCEEEVHQELAAQVMGQSDCGDIMIARPPLCGEIPPTSAGNADAQTHVDYLDAPNHEDIAGCVADLRFLVSYPGTRGDVANTPCRKWSLMRRLKMRLSQWGLIVKGDPLESTARRLVAIPVAGGTEDDPCYELRMIESNTGGIPTGTENCQILRFRGFGTEAAGWKAEKGGLMFYPVERKDLFTSTNVGTAAFTIELPDYPTDACGDVWVDLEVQIQTLPGASGVPTRLILTAGSYILGYGGQQTSVDCVQVKCPTSSSTLNLVRTRTGTGQCGLYIRILGYWK